MPHDRTLNPWHVLRVPRPQHVGNTALYEFALTQILERAGFPIYTPYRVEMRYRNKFDRARRQNKRERDFPLIVGYIFIRIEGERQWGELFRRGLVRCLMGLNGALYSFSDRWIAEKQRSFGRHWAKRTEDEIENGRKFETENIAPGYQAFMDTFKEFEVGDTACFRFGTLAGQEVKVTEILDTKARIMFKLFGIDQEQLVPIIELEKAE